MTTKKIGRVDTSETIGARIPVSEMVVDKEYQGHVNESLVEKIVKNWNEPAAGAVVLNLREDNTYAVLDGQHRVIAAKRKGVEDLNSLVFIGKSRKEEAMLFVQLNTKHNVRPIDRFRANLLAGRTEEKAISEALKELGLRITTNPYDATGVRCIVALKSMYTGHGLAHLKTVLGILQSAFSQYKGQHGKQYSDAAVLSVSQFIYRYPEADVALLIKRLSAYAPATIQGVAITKIDPGQSMWVGWGRAITGIYNWGVRSTSKTYLPPSRWDKKIYTPTGRATMSAIMKSRPRGQRFTKDTAKKFGARGGSTSALRAAAKTKKVK